jgi:hypothetical protein
MKRTLVILSVALPLLVACKEKPDAAAPPPPVTTSSAAASAPATATTTAPAIGTAPDVTAANAPVPVQGLELWLRADYGVTADAGGKVKAWAVEGSPLTAAPSQPAEQPTLVASAINGKPAVRFDGDQNTLEVPMSIDAKVSPQLTVISVWTSATAEKSPLRKLYGADDGGYDRAAGIDDRAEGSNYTVFGGSAGVVGDFTFTANTPNLTVESYDQTQKKLSTWANGAAKSNVDAEYSEMLDHFFIGSTGRVYHEMWQGDLAEMLVYRRVLTDDERKKVEDYLAGKYGLKLER